MTTAVGLPRGLEPWGEALAALTPAFATALAPMLHVLEDLFERRTAAGDEGPPDGYDGLSTRGTPERVLMSEWLLADEVPEEFLRRAATGELLHLALARRQPRRTGRVVVLVDNGPESLGAPRLAQLAALVVLHRRAHTARGSLTVGLLGDEPGTWIEGTAFEVLAAWRTRRSPRPPSAEDVDAWYAALAPGDEAWVLASGELADATPRSRVLAIRPGTWNGSGSVTLHADLDGDPVELVLPPVPLGVRALRGAEFRRTPVPTSASGHGIAFPSFPSQEQRLVLRGADATEVVVVPVAESRTEQAPRARRHGYDGPVVAATHAGRRLLVLVAHDDGVLRVAVRGKRIAWLDEIAVPAAEVGLPADALAALAGRPLAPMYLFATSLLVELGGHWYALSRDGTTRTGYVAATVGAELDQPLRVLRHGDTLHVHNAGPLPGVGGDERVVVGARRRVAVSADGRAWRTFRRKEPEETIVVDERDEVLALVEVDDRPHLVTRSAAGLVLRLAGPHSVRTLTRWSGGEHVAIHPTRPLLAVTRSPGVVEVGNYVTGETVHVVRGDE